MRLRRSVGTDGTGNGGRAPRPETFAGLMVAIGLFASWLGTLCWN
jgi:hypothetical protein